MALGADVFEIQLGTSRPTTRLGLSPRAPRAPQALDLPAGYACPALVVPLQTLGGHPVALEQVQAHWPTARAVLLVGTERTAAAWLPHIDEAEADALRRALALAPGWMVRDGRAIGLGQDEARHLVSLPRIVLTSHDWIADNTDAPLSMSALLDDMVQVVVGRRDGPVYPHVRLATGYLYQRGLHRVLRLLEDHRVEIRLLFSGHTDRVTAEALTTAFKEGLIDEVEAAGDGTFADLCRAALTSGRLVVRIYTRAFLHAKVFLATDETPRGTSGRAIIGSSNLSEAGLATGGNLELDVRVEGEVVIGRLRDWFDARWDEAEEPVPPLLEVVDQWRPEAEPRFATPGLLEVWRTGRQSRLAGPDQHLALLAGLYGDRALDVGPARIETWADVPHRTLTPSPEQTEGVDALRFRLRRSRLAFLADSVGLGKTVTALGAGWYLQRAGIIDQFAVVAPRKLHGQWRLDAERLGLAPQAFACLNRHLLERERPDLAQATLAPFGLVVVDEAHEVLRSRSNKLWQVLRAFLAAHPRAMLLLVSATPWNNSRDDIFAYLSLAWADYRLLEPHFSGLAQSPISEVFPMFQGATGARAFRDLGQGAYDLVFGAAFVQRTRTTLARRLATPPDFPVRRIRPESAPPSEPHEAFFATLNGALDRLHISYREPFTALQRALAALDPAGEPPRASNLMASFVLQLFKRAESSLYALAVSLAHVQRRLKQFRTDLETILLTPDPVRTLRIWLEETWLGDDPLPLDEADDPDLLGQPPAPEETRRANLDGLLARLTPERIGPALTWLIERELAPDEAELARLFKILNPELDQQDPKLKLLLEPVATHKSLGHKPILVAAYADTALRVFLRLTATLPSARIGLALGAEEGWVYHHSARHRSADLSEAEWCNSLAHDGPERRVRLLGGPEGVRRARRVARSDLLAAFAPRVQARSAEALHLIGGEVDILVGSEAISVGQNLQDSTALIHLDLPWNPMTLEQRIGRVDRRGGGRTEPGLSNKVVDIHYCWSLAAVENEVRLRQRLKEKIQGALRDTHFDELLLAEVAAEVQAARDDAERKQRLAHVLGDRQRTLAEQGVHVPDTDADGLSGSEVDGLRRLADWRRTTPDIAPPHPVVACGQLGHREGAPARWVLTLRLTPKGEAGHHLGHTHHHFTWPDTPAPTPLRSDLDAAVATLTSGPPSATHGLERRTWTEALRILDTALQAARARTLETHNQRIREALQARLNQPRREATESIRIDARNARDKALRLLQTDDRLRKQPHKDRIRTALDALQPTEAWRLTLAHGEATTHQWLTRIYADPRGFLTTDFEATWADFFAPAARADEVQPSLPTEHTWADLEVTVLAATFVRG